MASNNPNPPPRMSQGLNKARTFATQSEEAKKAFILKMFEGSVQSLRFAFVSGRVTTLHAICAALKLMPVGDDRVIAKEELTQLVLQRRAELAGKATTNEQATTATTTTQPHVPEEIRQPSVVQPGVESDKAEPPARATELEVVEEEDFYLPELTDNKAKGLQVHGFQIRKTTELLKNILEHKHRADLLLSGTGTGKTIMLGATIKALQRLGFFDDFAGLWPVLYVTKATVVKQTEDSLEHFFGLGGDVVHVVNVEVLRASLGKIFIHEETKVIQGQEHIIFKWRPRSLPRLVILDESQIFNNPDSTQSRIAQALNDVNTVTHGLESRKLTQIFSSATPFMRMVNTKCFAAATKVCTNQTWSTFAKEIALPATVEEYDPPAMERFMTVIKPFIVSVKGVRPKFPARNRVETIDFDNEQQRAQYRLAWERYEREMLLLKGAVKEMGTFQQLVAMMKFNQAAELIRHEVFARRIVDINGNGKAAVLAVKFKESIGATVKDLIKNYGYKRSDISIIWGGMGGTFGADGKVKLKEKRITEKIFKMFAEEDFDMLRSLNLRLIVVSDTDKDVIVKEVELSQELDERAKLTAAGLKSVTAEDLAEMRLGTQNAASRQREIDAFQSGRTKVCIFTFKAGGVGLSLHHHNDSCLPRESIIAPCYSAIELVQGLGRAPRLTSLSETIQTMLFYKGTIEEHVAQKVSQKLRCLKEVVKQREDWFDVICDAADKQLNEFTSSSTDGKTEVVDAGELGDSETEEDEEDGNETGKLKL